MVKKVISLVLAIGLFLNLSVSVFATGPELSISEFSVGDSNSTVVDYSTGDKDIRILFTVGYKFTTVTDKLTGEYDVYRSVKNDAFRFDNADDNIGLIKSNLSYENDIHIGHFNPSNPIPVPADQYLVSRYISTYLDAYFFQYSDDQYTLRYDEEVFSVFTSLPTEISHCNLYLFYLMEFDDSFRDACISGLSMVPGAGNLITVLEVYNNIDGENDAEELAEAIVSYMLATVFDHLTGLLYVVDGIRFIGDFGVTVNAYNHLKSEFAIARTFA